MRGPRLGKASRQTKSSQQLTLLVHPTEPVASEMTMQLGDDNVLMSHQSCLAARRISLGSLLSNEALNEWKGPTE